ncbi:MAG: hypothetical protein GJ680_01570 [Alteromonadaceae bacterium]|nr:hypothetical protein [Alteromonadaceae bacterium]
MKIPTFVSISLLLCSFTFANAAPLQAHYEITEANGHSQHPERKRPFSLWRISDNEVVHQYPKTGVSQHWTLQKNHRVKLIKLFDAHKRGIEYEATEIAGHQLKDWSEKHQLLDSKLLAKMTESKASTQGKFGKERYFRFHQDDVDLSLVWLAEHNLIKQMQVNKGGHSMTWQLLSIDFKQADVAEQYAKWDNYYLTDYADVGDNESDPFLMQMINLGFVEHGASGFYNEKGQPIEAASSHGHGHHGH